MFVRRGHTAEASIDAIEKIRANTDVDLGIHLIFGMPEETDQEIKRAAEICSSLPISNVKLHNLHVLTNTPLAKLYERGEFMPIEIEEYARRVRIFLKHLDPRIAVHRLAALSSRKDELIAPEWTAYKMKTYQYLTNNLKEHDIWQGDSFEKTEISCQVAHSLLQNRKDFAGEITPQTVI